MWRSPGRLMLTQCRNVFWTGRSTNFKLGTQTEHEDGKTRITDKCHDLQGQKSKSQVTWCIWQMLAHKSRMKSLRNTRMGRKVPTPWAIKYTSFKVKRSKVKVISPINAEIKSVSYLPSGKACQLQTWYRWSTKDHVSRTRAMTFKVKGQGRKLGHVVRLTVVGVVGPTKSPRKTKIGKEVAHPSGNNGTSIEVKCRRSRSPGRLMLKPKVCRLLTSSW